jgi:5-methylcytosine-specific restriction endonuclease McrA
MALPRYLEVKFSAYWQSLSSWEKLMYAICAGADQGPRVFDVLNTKKRILKTPTYRGVALGFIRARWAYFELRCHRKNDIDYMERTGAKLYLGLETLPSGAYLPDLRAVTVPVYFLAKLEQLNSERESNDRKNAALVKQIALVRSKVYASRCFPPHLRLLILERDGYRCQLCLRDRETLLRLRLRLEVDHILPFVDGGKTTYGNGRTLCNECNVAKHHVKGYLSAIHYLDEKTGLS